MNGKACGDRKKRKIKYSKKLCCFDIETTHENIDGHDVLYTWHWQAMLDDEYHTFSSWDDFLDTVVTWNDAERLIVFVHNLSYETEAIIRNLGDHEIDEIFATDTHKMLKFVLDGCVEFRCSYYLTNKSLAVCARDVGLKKLDMDYTAVRHPGDEISAQDAEYCKMDVVIMREKIRQLEKAEGMPFWDFPLTNTGFLRRELRKLMSKNPKNRKLFTNSRLNYKTFMCCRDCFMGGYTHANYIYMGETMRGVDSYDFGSAYPFAMLAHKYPMNGFHRVDNPTFDDIRKMIRRENVLFICRVRMRGVQCRFCNTFLSYSKCITTNDVQLDNGRIYSAGEIETALTSLDLRIMLTVYKIESIAVLELYWATADYLPTEYVKLMMKYYEQKQNLKHVPGAEVDYMKAKNRVNSFYGMAVTSPLRDVIELTDTEWTKNRLDYNDVNAVEEQLAAFYKSRNNFLPYQWGVFVPAWTRYHLWMDIIRHNDKRVIYCDTDSAKVIDRISCLHDINRYNLKAERMRRDRLRANEIEHDFPDLGIFDWETAGGAWKRFRTLGAKKYIVEDCNGRIASTVAGLSKTAVQYIDFDDFMPGLTFAPDISGRTVSHCITNEINTYDAGGCWIENTTYQLSISEDYALHTNYNNRFNWSDLIVSTNGKTHSGNFTQRDKIDLKVIKDKRNIYGVTL